MNSTHKRITTIIELIKKVETNLHAPSDEKRSFIPEERVRGYLAQAKGTLHHALSVWREGKPSK